METHFFFGLMRVFREARLWMTQSNLVLISPKKLFNHWMIGTQSSGSPKIIFERAYLLVHALVMRSSLRS